MADLAYFYGLKEWKNYHNIGLNNSAILDIYPKCHLILERFEKIGFSKHCPILLLAEFTPNYLVIDQYLIQFVFCHIILI